MTLHDGIEAQTEFEVLTRSNRVYLLLTIERHALDCEESRVWVLVVSDAFQAVFNHAPEDNEASSDCTRCFKAARQILQSHSGGPILVAKAIKTHAQHVRKWKVAKRDMWSFCSV